MPLKKPSIVNAVGDILDVNGSESGRGAFTAADLLGPKLLDTLNLLRLDVNEMMVPLSTGETSPIYFEDIRVDSIGTVFQLTHNLKRRVRWTWVDWVPVTSGQNVQLERDASSTDTMLALRSYRAGLLTLRVW